MLTSTFGWKLPESYAHLPPQWRGAGTISRCCRQASTGHAHLGATEETVPALISESTEPELPTT